MTEPLSPILDVAKARFVTTGMDDVQGWLIPSTALYLAGIETSQRGTVPGGICEIGVHRGKSFLTMVIDLPPGDPAVAIDVFDDQHLNLDGTSVDARKDFEANLERWSDPDRVDILQMSSLELEANGFLDGGPRFRMFSVDGGHNRQFVLNDLRLAEKTVVPGGVVAVDDIFNVHWLGVVTGFFDYVHAGGTLMPYALVPNKLLLTDPGSVEANRELLREAFGQALTKKDIPLCDGMIDRYDDIAWTVRSSDGTSAPLQRPGADNIAGVRAELAGVTLDRARLQQELRQATAQRNSLRTKLAAQEKETATARAAAQQARKAAAKATRALAQRQSPSAARVAALKKRIPPRLRGPARVAYRALARQRRRLAQARRSGS